MTESFTQSQKLQGIVLWILTGLLAAIFLIAGVPKLVGAEGWIRHFAVWGYPDWFRPIVGAVEVISAVLLVVPRLASFGACGIVVIMAGATYTHLHCVPDEAGRVAITLTLFGLAAVVGYARRPWKQSR